MQLAFSYMLTLVQGYIHVIGSEQFSQLAPIPYIPVDNIYRMDIFTIYYLNICVNIIPILAYRLHILCLSSFVLPTASTPPILLY